MNHYTFSIGDKYHEMAKRLVKQMKEFGITLNRFEYPDTGDWMGNAMIRSHIACKLKPPFWFFDCDLQCISDKPNEYEIFKEDCSAHCDMFLNERPNNQEHDRYSAGLIGCYTEKGLKTLQNWSRRCFYDKNPDMPLREQYYLYQAIQEEKPKVFQLMDIYNFVPPKEKSMSKKQLRKNNVVILHCPASRPPA